MDSGDDIDNEPEFIPNDEDCQKLVEQFVACTNTDEALAQFYLQDRNWNVRRSVNDYFNNLQEKFAKKNYDAIDLTEDSDDDGASFVPQSKNKQPKKLRIESVTLDSNSEEETSTRTQQGASKEVNKELKEFRFITWNIDGLNEKNLVLRTEAVCKIIEEEKADVVFLQEIIPASETILRNKLSNFIGLTGKSDEFAHLVNYYTMIFLRKSVVNLIKSEIINFEDTMMGRNLLTAEVMIGKSPLLLINTHLESTKDFVSTRLVQLKSSFKTINSIDKKSTVIYGGDLNLRDSELTSIGGLPSGIVDLWISSGQRKECQFTWDMRRNDNLPTNWGTYKPQCRFDRVYFRESQPLKVVPGHFGLIGLQRLKPHVCFPSDHWGIICQFKVW